MNIKVAASVSAIMHALVLLATIIVAFVLSRIIPYPRFQVSSGYYDEFHMVGIYYGCAFFAFFASMAVMPLVSYAKKDIGYIGYPMMILLVVGSTIFVCSFPRKIYFDYYAYLETIESTDRLHIDCPVTSKVIAVNRAGTFNVIGFSNECFGTSVGLIVDEDAYHKVALGDIYGLSVIRSKYGFLLESATRKLAAESPPTDPNRMPGSSRL